VVGWGGERVSKEKNRICASPGTENMLAITTWEGDRTPEAREKEEQFTLD
jgi:hypothetical protein